MNRLNRAYQLDNDKYEYEFKVVSMKMNVREIEKTLISAKRSAEILTIVSNVTLSSLFVTRRCCRAFHPTRRSITSGTWPGSWINRTGCSCR